LLTETALRILLPSAGALLWVIELSDQEPFTAYTSIVPEASTASTYSTTLAPDTLLPVTLEGRFAKLNLR
jgi:hypothetical protein